MAVAATRAVLTLVGHASPDGRTAHGGAQTLVGRHLGRTDLPDQV
jgi:hypothetical protein